MTVTVTLKGVPELKRRLNALDDFGPLMRDLAHSAVNEQKHLVPVKTGNLRHTIHVGRVTKTSAETIASANYAAHVEFGTKAHEIRPRSRRTRFAGPFLRGQKGQLRGGVLRWKTGGSVRFAASVRHPGTRARPFMIPGAERAVSGSLRDGVIARWNRAA